MAAAELWKNRFRQRVVQADGRCSQVPELITAAPGHLVEQHVHAAVGPVFMFGGDRIQLAEESLRRAGNDLGLAIYELGAANAITLRGGAAIPSMPLPSIHRLHDKDLALWSAVGKVRDAMGIAEQANALVEICCDHLLVIRLLLPRPGLPGVDSFIATSASSLSKPRRSLWRQRHLTAGALQDLAGGGGGGAN